MASSAASFFSNNPFSNSPLFQASEKVKFKNAVCVSVNTESSCFEYCSMDNMDENSLVKKEKEFSSPLFSEDFYKEFTDAVRGFAALRSTLEDTSVTLLLPDKSFCMDTVNIPNIGRRRNDEAINATVSGLYNNLDDLYVNHFSALQTKQVATYTLTVARKELIDTLSSTMEEAGLKPTCITFTANCTVNAATQLTPELKTDSFMLMDIKENSTVISFASKGRTIGFYDLPFGYSVLSSKKVESEDMLFDHSVAELAVLNAREKARAKQLTMMGGAEANEELSEEEKLDAEFGDEEGSTVDPTAGTTPVTYKTLPKKVPRKLPKFMLRPEPTTDEETTFENFRVFIKWVLTLKEANIRLTSQGEPTAVYVNMPEEFDFLFETTNEEKEENEIEFLPLHGKRKLLDILELYGALYAPTQNRSNIFMVNGGKA